LCQQVAGAVPATDPAAPAAPDAPAALVRSTYGDEAAARAAARALVEEGLAACVHVLPIQSCYRWEGAVVQEGEWLLEARVVGDGARRAADRVARDHPYELPLVEVVASSVTHAYAAWARGEAPR
jgi:periplasmic divalent cation tolerance protein